MAVLFLFGAAGARAQDPPTASSPAVAVAAESSPADSTTESEADTDEQNAVVYTEKRKGKLSSLLGEDDESEGPAERLHWGPLYPSAIVLSQGASVGPILHVWQRDLANSGLDFYGAAAYSIRQYQYYSAKFGRLPHRRSGPPSFPTGSDKLYPLADVERLTGSEGRFDFYAGYRYRYYPEEDFYGIGSGSSPDDRTDYGMRDDFGELVATFHFTPGLALTARAGVLKTSLGTGRDDFHPDVTTLFDNTTAPGLRQQPDMVILAAGFLADLRDEPGNPHRGMLLTLGMSRFDDRNGSAFEFTRTAGDLRFYLPLGSHRHVIATRALASVDLPDGGSRVPFYLQSQLGGGQVLRGYPGARFRDNRLVAFSAEYRFEAIPKLELAVFYDAGDVVPHRAEFQWDALKTSWGAGVRYKTTRRVLARFDVARSTEGTRYLVKFGPSF